MSLTIYAHPFSSYCQKVLIALWENGTDFVYRHLEDAGISAELAALWPLRLFPIVTDGDRVIVESSIIIDYLDRHYLGPIALVPAEPDAALEVRLLDRFFDNYVMAAMQKPVAEATKGDDVRTAAAIVVAHDELETAYAWLERRLAGRTWAAGDDFSMADCAAAPSLFYAAWVHEIAPHFPWLRAYRANLLVRPSVARAVEEGRPYRHYFPLGAPDRD